MFQRACAFSFIFLLILTAATYWFCVRNRGADAARYRSLVRESAELRSKRALERHPAHQTREGVQKDIWMVSGEERPHLCLKSAHSYLTLTQKKDKFEAVEELQQLFALAQEEIDRPRSTQQVRALTAQSGLYTFPSHRFCAQTARLCFFRLPGTDLPLWNQLGNQREKPYLSGTAKEVLFDATSKMPTFTATYLQAKLDPERGAP